MQRNDLMVWVDLEMTSINDVLIDRITEIAIVITDKELHTIAEMPSIVIHTDKSFYNERRWAPIGTFPEADRLMDEAEASTVTMEEADGASLAFIEKYVEAKTAPLCGNSIHSDRHFLKLQMPKFESHLFYRCIDVSSLKELARRWAPEIYVEAERRKAHKTHRAMDDIHQSIKELQFYRAEFLKLPTPTQSLSTE